MIDIRLETGEHISVNTVHTPTGTAVNLRTPAGHATPQGTAPSGSRTVRARAESGEAIAVSVT
jgi:hypothetical protein